MTQPLLHHRDVDAGETQMGGRGVAPEVNGMNLFTFHARRLVCGFGQVSAADPEKTGACQAGTALVEEEVVTETRLRGRGSGLENSISEMIRLDQKSQLASRSAYIRSFLHVTSILY